MKKEDLTVGKIYFMKTIHYEWLVRFNGFQDKNILSTGSLALPEKSWYSRGVFSGWHNIKEIKEATLDEQSLYLSLEPEDSYIPINYSIY